MDVCHENERDGERYRRWDDTTAAMAAYLQTLYLSFSRSGDGLNLSLIVSQSEVRRPEIKRWIERLFDLEEMHGESMCFR